MYCSGVLQWVFKAVLCARMYLHHQSSTHQPLLFTPNTISLYCMHPILTLSFSDPGSLFSSQHWQHWHLTSHSLFYSTTSNKHIHIKTSIGWLLLKRCTSWWNVDSIPYLKVILQIYLKKRQWLVALTVKWPLSVKVGSSWWHLVTKSVFLTGWLFTFSSDGQNYFHCCLTA